MSDTAKKRQPISAWWGAAFGDLGCECRLAGGSNGETVGLVEALFAAMGVRQHPLAVGTDMDDAEIQSLETFNTLVRLVNM
jgi:hypothetical protein